MTAPPGKGEMKPAAVPYDSPAAERGLGVFETVLLVGRRAVLWDAHTGRLLGSLRRLELPGPSPGDLLARAAEELDEAGVTDDGAERAVRLAWVAVGADLDDPASFRLDVSLRPIPAPTLGRRSGVRAVTLPPSFRRDTPWLKSTSYAAAVLGLRHARRCGGDEGLFVDERGGLVEGTSTALLAYEGGGWAGLGPLALQSVTAEAFLAGRGTRRAVLPEEVRRGAVLIGSLTTAAPIVALDGVPCAAPEAMVAEVTSFTARLRTDPSLSRPL